METVTISLYLVKTFGPTLARILLATLLKGNVNLAAIEHGEIAETLADSLDIGGLVDKLTDGNRKAVRNAEYVFGAFGDEAAENLIEVFQEEGDGLPETEWRNTVDAAKDTLNRHAMPLLVKENLDAHRFRAALRRIPPRHALDTEAQETLYDRLLDTASQMIFAIADTLPNFTRDSTAMILQNEANLLERIDKVLADQERILVETYGQRKDEADLQFESEYRSLIESQLNTLELFGIRNLEGAKQPLSVAYIRLRVDVQPSYERHGRGAKAGIGEVEAGRGGGQQLMSVEEALNRGSRILVVSDAGSGKTTLLKWIAVRAASSGFDAPLDHWSGKIPFVVRLRDYARADLPAIDTLPVALRETSVLTASVPQNWAIQQLRSRRAIVLLDGMDEISGQKQGEVLDWLDQLLTLFPDAPIVVSSRPSGLRTQSLSESFQRLNFQSIELQEMEDAQVELFVERWHRAIADDHCRYADKSRVPDREQALKISLQQQESLRGLARTPILCSMLCALNLLELAELPRDRILLYDRCIDILIQLDSNRGIDLAAYAETLRPSTVRRLLARIAYWMMKNDRATIGRKDAERLLAAEGLNAEPVLTFLADRSVVFHEVVVNEYAFIHRTFSEYLAAQEIVRIHEVAAATREYCNRSEWYETIRLLAGHVELDDQAALMDTLFEQAVADPANRRSLHLLAWGFWELLDTRTADTELAMDRHLRSLNLGGATSLDLSNSQIANVSKVADLPHLKRLVLDSTQVSDIAPLSRLGHLKSLFLGDTRVRDITPLAGLTNLEELFLFSTQIDSLEPLRGLTNLRRLFIESTQVAHLDPLVGATELEQLHLSDTKVHDVTPLAQMEQLQWLVLSDTPIDDVTPLAGSTNLEALFIKNTQVHDVSPLIGLNDLGVFKMS